MKVNYCHKLEFFEKKTLNFNLEIKFSNFLYLKYLKKFKSSLLYDKYYKLVANNNRFEKLRFSMIKHAFFDILIYKFNIKLKLKLNSKFNFRQCLITKNVLI